MAVEEYISRQLRRLGSSIDAGDMPTTASRYIGGHSRENQPFVTGYHQCVFKLPEGQLFSNGSDVQKWLASTCEGFTPHSTNINFIDVNGIGQLGSSFPASRTYNREFTLTFREYRKLPILNIFRTWLGLFDPHTGITSFNAEDWIPLNYKGAVFVALLKPTSNKGKIEASDIEEVYFYEGVFPTGVPDDSVTASDQATNDSVQASVTFKFDGAPIDASEEGVVNAFLAAMAEVNYQAVNDKIGLY